MGIVATRMADISVPQWQATTDDERAQEAQRYANTLFRAFAFEMSCKSRAEIQAYMQRWDDLEENGAVHKMDITDQAALCDEVAQRLLADLPATHIPALYRAHLGDCNDGEFPKDAAATCNLAAMILALPDDEYRAQQLAEHLARCRKWANASGPADTN